MGSTAHEITDDGAGSLGTSIEIKIKTMDSQTYTMRVDKQMPVPALKEQIASVTGILRDRQRLICRGKVLKDDQLLSAYHVEDGHTLHLVVREPGHDSVLSSTENLSDDQGIGSSSTNRGQYYQVAPGIVVETFNMPGQGDRALPDIGRIVSAVLGSIGATNPVTGNEGAGVREIPDALTTLSEYLGHMTREFTNNGRASGLYPGTSVASAAEERQPSSASPSGSTAEVLPTPITLAQLLSSTRQMLNQQTGDNLLQLTTQLENQASVTDASVRLSTQSSAWRTGVLLQNLGAYLLELGRTTMTLRLGRAPSEAVVNAGPAVFVSSTGPNPIMVQPLPFQPGASFGGPSPGTSQPGSGLLNSFGAGFLPRRIDIQIRRGLPSALPGSDGPQPAVPPNVSNNTNGEIIVNQAAAGTSEALNRRPAVRVLPIRTAIGPVPDLNRAPPDSSGNSSGANHSLLGRLQNAAFGNLDSRVGSDMLGEHLLGGFRVVQQPTTESVVGVSRQQISEDPITQDQAPASGPAQGGRIRARTIDVNVVSAGGAQNDQNAEGQIPSSVLQLLRGLFPGGEIHVENAGSQELQEEPVADRGRASSSSAHEEEPGVTPEGLFLSRVLQQIMPLISPLVLPAIASQHPDGAAASSQATTSEAGASDRHIDSELEPPNPKRQKME